MVGTKLSVQCYGDVTVNYMAEENHFKLSRSEFANKQGISVDNLKKRMKRGYYQNHFVKHNGKYLFSTRETDGPNMVNSPGTFVPTKARNRGNHFGSKNPNYKPQFKRTNEIRMLAKLKHNIDEETQALLPEAVEIAKQKKVERIRSATQDLERPSKNYGTGIFNMSNKGYGTRAYSSPIAHRFEPNKFRSQNRGPKIPKKGPYEI